MPATQIPPGQIDVWEFDLLEEGGELRCESALTFAYYLLSESTKKLSVEALTTQGIPRGSFTLRGPTAEDGKPLQVSYELNQSEFKRLPNQVRNDVIGKVPNLMHPVIPSWRVYSVLGIHKSRKS